MHHRGAVALASSRLLALVVVIASSGCFGCRERCVSGASIACACTDGRTGAQVCADDGRLGACVCTGDTDGGEVGVDSSVGTDAGDSATPCLPADPPIEACNGLDDDCDGSLDPEDCVPGLEAWYRFEETDGPVLDSSGNGWDGTAIGAVIRGATGPIGTGVSFTGGTTDRVAVIGGPVYDVSTGWTIEAWVGYPEPGGTGALVKGPGGGAPGALDFEFLVSTAPGGTNATASWNACDASSCFALPGALWMPVTRFVHFAASWDGTSLHGYLNGSEYASQLQGAAFFALWDNDLSMGNFVAAAPIGWIGTLDEVKLWSIARSAEEICFDAHGTYSPGPPASCALP